MSLRIYSKRDSVKRSYLLAMPTRYLQVGDEVAMLPFALAAPSETLEIARILHATPVYIQLTDGRMFATIGGKSLLSSQKAVIVPATDEHRAVVAERQQHFTQAS